MNESKIYRSTYLPQQYHKANVMDFPWEQIAGVELVETVTGQSCTDTTTVRSYWWEDMLCFQFVCLDQYAVSDFTQHDDPLYEQDVIEIFIDELGTGKRYIELEVSPNNILFDAIIYNDGDGNILATDLAWQAINLQTHVVQENDYYIYYVGISAENFQQPLNQGKGLKVNFYRIDEKEDGTREFQAWSPTGAIQYHLPAKFGTLILQ